MTTLPRITVNAAQLAALARAVLHYSAGAATAIAGASIILDKTGVLTPDQAAQVHDNATILAGGLETLSAGHALGDGLATFVGAGFTVASILAAAWGVWRKSHAQVIAAAARTPNTTIVTTPAMAAAVPAANVVGADRNEVIPTAPVASTVQGPAVAAAR